jgi:hypothetical protein
MPDTSKSSFIRQFALTIPVAEILEKAKEQNLEIKPKDVYNTRTYMRRHGQRSSGSGNGSANGVDHAKVKKRKAKKTKAKAAAKPAAPAAVEAVVARVRMPLPAVVELLKSIAGVVGLSQAIDILQEQHASVMSMLQKSEG